MSTNLTVADVREALWQQVTPDCKNSEQFIPKLNQVSERIINSGFWKGMFGVVDFNSATEYITLPRRWESIVGCTMYESPIPVYGRLHEYLSSGPGFYEHLQYNLNLLIDQGEYPTEVVQSEALPIRLTIANVEDVGQKVRLYGVDTNGDPVFDSGGSEGVTVTLANPSVTTSQSFILTGVAKDPTMGNVTISSVDGVTVTQLSVYEPSETRPMYRRYKVGTVAANNDGTPVIRTLCKRRFIKLTSETDLVYPGDLGALKFGLIAVNYEEQGANELAKAELFWQKCYQVLNQSLKQQRGNIRMPMNFILSQSGGGTPQTH